MTKLSYVVAKLKGHFNKVMATVDSLSPAEQYYVFILNDLFAHFEEFTRMENSKCEANASLIKPFINFVETYWHMTTDGKLINPYRESNPIASYCIDLAYNLHEIAQVHPFKILFPAIIINPQNDYALESLPSLVMGDGGKTVIDVFKCLNNYTSPSEKRFLHTHPIGENHNLSVDEITRIKEFNSVTKYFFKHSDNLNSNHAKRAASKLKQSLMHCSPAIIFEKSPPQENAMTQISSSNEESQQTQVQHQEIEAAQNEVFSRVQNANPHPQSPLIMQNIPQENIVEEQLQVAELTPEGCIEILTKIDKANWQKELENIGSDRLKKIFDVITEQDIAKKIESYLIKKSPSENKNIDNLKNENTNDLHDLAALYLGFYLYKEIVHARPSGWLTGEYNTITGRLSSLITGAYSFPKDVKEKTSELVMQTILEITHSEFLYKGITAKIRAQLPEQDQIHIGALNQGNLKNLYQLTERYVSGNILRKSM